MAIIGKLCLPMVAHPLQSSLPHLVVRLLPMWPVAVRVAPEQEDSRGVKS